MKPTIFLVLLVLTACITQTNQAPTVTPKTQDETIKPNTEIVLRETPSLKDVYDATGIIDLILYNKSDSRVLFPPDFNAEVFVQKGTSWEKLDNYFGYSIYDRVLSTSSDGSPSMLVAVAPDLTQIADRPIVLRINVKGTLSDSGKEVEAYLDVPIE